MRLAALKAVRGLLPCGATEMIRDLAAFRESNLLIWKEVFDPVARQNYMARLCEDPNHKVRLEFFSVIEEWACELPERGNYETLLAPYLLSAFSDPSVEIQAIAIRALKRLGEEWLEGHDKEMEDEMQYQPQLQALAEAQAKGLPSFLPPPFTSRPLASERACQNRFIWKLMKAVTNELNDWKSEPRERALSLLRTLLVLGEGYLSQFSHVLLPALLRVLIDGTKQRRSPTLALAENILALMGRYCAVGSLRVVLLDMISGESYSGGVDRQAFCASLQMATCLVRGLVPSSLTQLVGPLLELLYRQRVLAT